MLAKASLAEIGVCHRLACAWGGPAKWVLVLRIAAPTFALAGVAGACRGAAVSCTTNAGTEVLSIATVASDVRLLPENGCGAAVPRI